MQKASQLAPSAYLASAAGCSSLLQEVLASPALIAHGDNVDSALQLWSVGHSQLPPSFPDSLRQCNWDKPHIEVSFNSLLSKASDVRDTAHLLATSCSVSGSWLNALPKAVLGLWPLNMLFQAYKGNAVTISVGPQGKTIVCLVFLDRIPSSLGIRVHKF